jgi:hypothetical protein
MNASGVKAVNVGNDGTVNFPTGKGSGVAYVDVTITAAQLKALNATPQTVVAAPGAGYALVLEGALLTMTYGTAAYAGIAAGEDLSFKYTNGSGAEVGQCETTGFLDQTSDQLRYVRAQAAASGNSAVTPIANAALVLHMLSGEITTGDSPLKVRVFYRVIPTTIS